ncbi:MULTISPECIES: polysaccharide deacetylase family protein [unclassified Mesorhizobium]|uniref:polysaccharide deacetylase family protein n=1 Tax=unclassified Mesorhizobium TaxID=325217 RepID=UPI00112837C5|nr:MULTISPECIES: polysaccharide deacetylase family protein [unclassified Mesorhizobium]MBZ9704505.1 polysaccharide deacetylase family protein [Mesorhizobium sp. CO1-1-3]MBZ9897322.1 polysaccharide deacetylase family protein [Mesorhizobium sp. BR1-1-6]TPI56366.1 polysaccharide deacetylase [Mesorhizobium sp. B3-1-1]TPI97281.1 polysaccharide deacetylase [Mesorhizobium sp. B2-8-1]TPJ71594.1 polysaccharide deacetylase [Mesorhizobium sp. B2-6-7]
MIDGGEAIRKLALNVARYTGLAPLAKPLVGGIGAILMLHRVTAKPEKPDSVNRHLNIAPGFLDAMIAGLKADGYAFVSMDEAVERIAARGKGGQFAAITADDAYRDNMTEALPVLEKHGAPITIYVAPGLINGTADLWWDVVEDLVNAGDRLTLTTSEGKTTIDCTSPAKKLQAIARLHTYLTSEVREEDLRAVLRELAHANGVDAGRPRVDTLMTWSEIRAIAAHPLVTIGAHTINHSNLKRLSEADARHEIVGVKSILRAELGEEPRHFAYPYGYASAVGCREVGFVRDAGYTSAVTTRHGVLRAEHAGFLHALPRISVNGRYQNLAHIRTMLSGVTTPLANAGKMVVTI